MLRTLIGFFIVLHGLVHLWYVTLSQQWVPFEPEMGWTGESWLLSRLLAPPATRTVATALFGLSTAAFVVSGITIFSRAGWSSKTLLASAFLSTATMILFWDGATDHIVEKGLLGVALNVAIIAVVLLSR